MAEVMGCDSHDGLTLHKTLMLADSLCRLCWLGEVSSHPGKAHMAGNCGWPLGAKVDSQQEAGFLRSAATRK